MHDIVILSYLSENIKFEKFDLKSFDVFKNNI